MMRKTFICSLMTLLCTIAASAINVTESTAKNGGNELFRSTEISHEKEEQTPMEQVAGNWFSDDAEGRWTYGIYDSLTIYNNRFYSPVACRTKGKRIVLTLKDRENGQMLTLQITPQNDGSALIGRDKGKARRYVRNRPEQPAIAADNGYGKNVLRRDSVCLQGYLRGYTPQTAGFSAGMVYLQDVLKRKDYPTAVPIASDGSFKCTFPVQHPIMEAMDISKSFVCFYAEPGDTVTLYIDMDDITRSQYDYHADMPNMQYMGRTAQLAYLCKEITDCFICPYSKLENFQKTLTPAQFQNEFKHYRTKRMKMADELCQRYAPSQKAVTLIRNQEAVETATYLLDFLRDRKYMHAADTANTVLTVQPESSYYDFLKAMPLNDEALLINYGTRIFINRFEYMEPFMTAEYQFKYMHGETDEEGNKTMDEATVDSLVVDSLERIVNDLCGTENVPLLWQVATTRDLKTELRISESSEAAAQKVHNRLHTLRTPYMQTVAAEMLEEHQAAMKRTTYDLPDTKATEIFRRLIAPYRGKVLFVDFWATTCGPCRAGIQQTANLREQYRNHPEFKFIYITSEAESPEAAYRDYVEKNLKGEVSYRLNDTDYKYMRELFGFNGIPHYVVVEKDGSICTENVEAYNLNLFLERRFGKKQ